MRGQMNLFDGRLYFGTEPHKLVRKDDPDTSHQAASTVDTSKLESLVYETIVLAGDGGCISDDVRLAHPGRPYSSITARFKALLDKGLIVDTGRRLPGISGRMQRVLVAAKFWDAPRCF